jgi:hypothetical protein
MISWRLTFLTWRMKLQSKYMMTLAAIKFIPMKLWRVFKLKPKNLYCNVTQRCSDGAYMFYPDTIIPGRGRVSDYTLAQVLPADSSADELAELFWKTLNDCVYGSPRTVPKPKGGWPKHDRDHYDLSVEKQRDALIITPYVLAKASGRTGKLPAQQGQLQLATSASNQELVTAFKEAFSIIDNETPRK